MSGAAPTTRRRARERALQILFGLEFTAYELDAVLPEYWEANPAKPGVRRYAERLVRGVVEQQAAIDAHLAQAQQRWSLARIGRVELAVLRVALYEMRYLEDVPPRVAINEALEVVKRYGADDAPRFVNGVLDRCREQFEQERAGSQA